MQPLDPIYTDGQPLRLALTYHDPDAISHRVRFLILLMTPDGARTPVPAGEDIVGPQQTLTLGTASAALSRVARGRESAWWWTGCGSLIRRTCRSRPPTH